MRIVLAFAAASEGALGLTLLVYPPIVIRLLLGAEIVGVGDVVSRFAGIALIGLGMACWPNGSARQPLYGMLTYSTLATLFLVYIGVRGEGVGVLLWPAVVIHALLSILLLRARYGKNEQEETERTEKDSFPKPKPLFSLLSPVESVQIMVKRLVREPLVHFLLIGAMLFAVDHYVQPARGAAPSSKQIQLTLDDLGQLVMLFQSQWRREPTAQELSRLVENKVQEEILYREGLAMGLDKDDTIVKRRMAQKLQFLAEDVAAAREPTVAELKSWFEKNKGMFAQPSRVSFRHLYFSPDRRGNHARDDAEKALAKFAGQAQDSKLAATLADPFMFQDYYRDRAPDNLGKEFGPQFAQTVAKLAPGSWQGPIESGFGWHLVFVDTLIPGRVPAFEEIESDVKTAWLGEQKAQAWQKAYKEMRAKYTVLLPAPPDKEPARAPTPAPRKENPTVSGEGTQ